jgi:hypothetical protein
MSKPLIKGNCKKEVGSWLCVKSYVNTQSLCSRKCCKMDQMCNKSLRRMRFTFVGSAGSRTARCTNNVWSIGTMCNKVSGQQLQIDLRLEILSMYQELLDIKVKSNKRAESSLCS